MSATSFRAMQMSHDRDPAAVIWDQIAQIDNFDRYVPSYNNVMVAHYIRPKKTAGGIIVPEKTLDEENWQGKTYLVVKLGAMAFKDDDNVKFGGFKAEVGEWVNARSADGWPMTIKDVAFRFFRDVDIKGLCPIGPDMTW